ncbi:TetR/AcrR family transcriptional regulator [uncultured Serinicoccus sp.]|uniref:TetR/AcrR family transcriptional regulator n=1 Tax=uncultured Serinicoccus sp. TaxID=735514 RepID=UPI0026017403|nr:TetR/AcrR family transcriptional regulator [uncultured Serinicoccus sp.]
MDPQVKRHYRSPYREGRARETRRRVRQAATRLFIDRGYVQTTVRDIADAAGVGARTVHTAYPGGKPEIFHRALDVAIAGDEEPTSQSERMAATGMLDRPTELVTRLVEQTAALLDRAGPLIMTTVTSSGADAHMRRLANEGAAATHANVRAVAVALAEAGLLRPGIDADHAADILFTLCSPTVHALLRHDRSWDGPAYRDWLDDAIRRTLITDEPSKPTHEH